MERSLESMNTRNNISSNYLSSIFSDKNDISHDYFDKLSVRTDEEINQNNKKLINLSDKKLIKAAVLIPIIFDNNKVNGIIDFTFSCNEFYAFEVAICFNALCFDGHKNNLSFNVTKAKHFIDGYSSIRKLSDEEKNSIKILSQGAALRFLLTRVFDSLNTIEGAIVKVKDPLEYLKRLEFHKNSKNYIIFK